MQLRFFKIYRENKLLLIFLISSFIISLVNFNIQTNFFGKYLLNNDGSSYHGILRSPPEVRMWKEAYKFKNDTNLKIIKDNEFKYHLLPSLNLGFVGKIFNINFFDKNNKIDIEGINYFFLTQLIFYFFSVILFYIKLLKIGIDRKVVNICVFFLLFEPTINQFNYTIFGETIFFSIILIIFSILIDLPKKNINYFFFGLLLGICYLQRSVAMLIIVIPIFVIFFKVTKKPIIKIIYLLTSYILVFMFLGFMNFNRVGIFYFLPTSTKHNLYVYLIPKIMGSTEKISENDAHQILNLKKENFIKIKKLELENEKDRFVLYDWQKKEAVDYIIDNKVRAFEVILKSSIYSMLLNPTEILFNRIKGKDYYKSILHKETIKYRIIYTLIIYILVLIGFVQSIRQKIILPHIFFLIGLSLFAVSSWVGYTRYFVPTLLTLSLYISYGTNFLINLINKKLR